MTNSLLVPARSTSAVLAQLSSRQGVVGERGGSGERSPHERRTPSGPQAVPDDIADDKHRGILGAFGDQVEVAADALGGRHESRCELQSGALGQLGRGERIANRTQILKLVLGRPKTLAQRGELLVAHFGLSAKAGDQRFLAVLARTQMDLMSCVRGHRLAAGVRLPIPLLPKATQPSRASRRRFGYTYLGYA